MIVKGAVAEISLAVVEVFKIVFHVVKPVETQLRIYIAPIVKGAVVGVHGQSIVALAFEVVDVAVKGLVVPGVVAAAVEEVALHKGRAAAEHIVYDFSVDAFILDGVETFVGISDKGQVELGKVVEAFQHDRHHIDLLIRRDRGVVVGLPYLFHITFVVALRHLRQHILGGVEKGVDQAVGLGIFHFHPFVEAADAVGAVHLRRQEKGLRRRHKASARIVPVRR